MSRIEVADGSLSRLRELSEDTHRMFEQRVILEQLGIRPHGLPLCEDETAFGLSTYFERVRLECLTRVRSDTSSSETDLDLWNYLRSASHYSPYAIEYWTFITTMQYLAEMGRASSYGDGQLSANLVDTTTFWNFRHDPSSLIEIVDELNKITMEAMDSRDKVGVPRLLKGAHYFGMSVDLLTPLCPGTDSNCRPTA